ncbi:hypothetical protein TRFO_32145 [Tritrichomonas foetus]|uniref:ubiquitinyl hydrolase 1 n=1 Tax=Tritrichomonas foetus TaxID=1144522 RepID=A0A1J4JUQ2_9EUKA|nr:hypothetical protein TRFO_32145 [Tritrichomonas foetus]|eukprot:OHT00981.1 hypothetical protein TRFO_32145 [Tritrichomonas foetus]
MADEPAATEYNFREFRFSRDEIVQKQIIQTKDFTIKDRTFYLKFKLSLKSSSDFMVNVTCTSHVTDYGLVTIRIFKEGYQKKKAQKAIISNFTKNTPKPFKIPIKCNELEDYFTHDYLSLYFSYQPKEKNASPVVNPIIKAQASRMAIPRRYFEYNSKQETGFVGLRNDSSICYMNSLLQAIYNIPSFRKIIYASNSHLEVDVRINVMLNLQILFYTLQTSPTLCNTTPLRTSFGWTQQNAYQQEDLQEFWTLLLDNILGKIRGTEQSNQVIDLFRIQSQKIIHNPDFNYHEVIGQINEMFLLQLCIINSTDIQSMITNYLAPDVINRDIPNVGEKACFLNEQFVSLPRVLFLHLLRYNISEVGEVVKINKPITYQEIIEIPFQNSTVKYILHGVLVHLGSSAEGGHYKALLRPTIENEWFSFNDERVEKCPVDRALSQFSDCYLLIYAREDTEQIDFAPVTNEDIPENIRDIAEKTELDLIEVPIITLECINSNTKEYKNDFRHPDKEISIDVGSNETTESLYSKIQSLFELKTKFRLWTCRYDGSPENVLRKGSIKATPYCRGRHLFLETGGELFSEDNNIFTILKFFNSKTSKLTLIGLSGIPLTSKPVDLFVQISTDTKLPFNQKYTVFHKSPLVHSNDLPMAEINKPFYTLVNFTNGSTLIFQAVDQPPFNDIGGDEISYYSENDGLFTTFLKSRFYTVRASLYMDSLPFDPICNVKYPSEFSVQQLKEFVAPLVGVDYDKSCNSLLLFFENGPGSYRDSIGKEEYRQPFCATSDKYAPNEKLYVKFVPDIPDSEINSDSKKTVVIYTSSDSFIVDNIIFAIENESSTISDIIQNNEINITNPRISLMRYGRIEKIVSDDTKINEINESVIRIDEIQDDGICNESNCLLVVNIEAEREGSKILTPQMSFFLSIIPDETFVDTKQRIKIICDIDDAKFSRLRYHLMVNSCDPNVIDRLPKLNDQLVLSSIGIPDLRIDIQRSLRMQNYHQMALLH